MGVCGNSGFLLGTNVSTLDRIARVWSNLFVEKEKKSKLILSLEGGHTRVI